MVKIKKINLLIENDRLEFKFTKYKIGGRYKADSLKYFWTSNDLKH